MATMLFIVLPYVAVILAIGAGLHRRLRRRYTFSSLSSQLLENRKLFWGSVPWHYGITLILLAHLLAWLFPGAALAILGHGVRLFIAEVIGLALALLTAFGLVVLIIRRLPTDSRARAVTSGMDWVLLFFLLVQVLTGTTIAFFDRWGSLWFLSTAVPWLWSLLLLQPDISRVMALPFLIQFHLVWGFLLILLFPFSRLVHIFTIPLEYLWRPYQVVIWYREPRRDPRLARARGPAGSPPHPRAPVPPTTGRAGLPPSGASATPGALHRSGNLLPSLVQSLQALSLRRMLLRSGRFDFAGPQDTEGVPDASGEPLEAVASDEYLRRSGATGRPEDVSRRSFLTMVSIVTGAIASAIIVVPSIAFLLGLRKAPQVWRVVGKASDFKVGETVEVSFADPSSLPWAGVTAKTAAWLRRVADDQFIAFSINCTHLGCPVRWLPSAGLFMCPCHGGVFYRDGKVASGPPPKPLVTYPVRVNRGLVEILASPLPITTR